MSRRSTLVHKGGPYDVKTACGKFALLEDGTRLLETDTDPDQIGCKQCLRSGARS